MREGAAHRGAAREARTPDAAALRRALRAKALRWLSQREHSRQELRNKLLRAAHAATRQQADASVTEGSVTEGSDASAPGLGEDACQVLVEALLAELAEAGHLSDERFVESRVHARARRFGTRRIEVELSQHGLQPDAATVHELRSTEAERAMGIWKRRFGTSPDTREEQLRQSRFLAQRGFDGSTIRQLWRQLGQASSEPPPED